MTDDEVVEALRIAARAGTLPPPATPEAVAAAEEVIGFPLPPLLRRLYVEVANGGFGPNEGILGVRGGAAQGNFADIAELYQDGPDPSGRIPAGLVLIYDWGCTIWSLVDFRDPAGVMWCNHEGECWSQGVNLAEWLMGTLAGTLTAEALLESQPTS
ncbi:SMI1/KNR4 family protein [Streptomyces lavendulae]|uniref:SMI1/KNR4 family protein n=1 Tax=Streptomyces sp. SUK 48 TaxID=2582831 RepID=UPI0011CD4504|nr:MULTISPECIES: SMI1/KNR4 family protein [Streptomyces]TXJ85233.1 SMI1/KNR4 family protein [Streptomyces lavendulae]